MLGSRVQTRQGRLLFKKKNRIDREADFTIARKQISCNFLIDLTSIRPYRPFAKVTDVSIKC
jgi:hypothetical protein